MNKLKSIFGGAENEPAVEENNSAKETTVENNPAEETPATEETPAVEDEGEEVELNAVEPSIAVPQEDKFTNDLDPAEKK